MSNAVRLPDVGDKYRLIKPFTDWLGYDHDAGLIAICYDFEVQDDGFTSYFLQFDDGETIVVSASEIDEYMERELA